MIISIHLWIIKQTDAAYLFSTTDESRDGDQVWVPRSMVERITKFPETPGKWRECAADIQEWFAEKKGLI